jgi:hypothetical protein
VFLQALSENKSKIQFDLMKKNATTSIISKKQERVDAK